MGSVTKEEFEASFAVTSGILIAQLPGLGLEAVPCNCGLPGCKGWVMVSSIQIGNRRVPALFVDRFLNDYKDLRLC